MSDEKITQLIRKVHEDELHKKIVREILDESDDDQDVALIGKLNELLGRVDSSPSTVLSFPKKNIRLAEAVLMAAAGQNLGSWYAAPLVFSSEGIVVDIRKVIGSSNEVDVYIHSHTTDTSLIEKNLDPFKGQTLLFKLSSDGNELMSADIYVDPTGQRAEGVGKIRDLGDDDLLGDIQLDVVPDE